ncbi:tryptophan aminotransferase-related protein 4-like [Henckelia pumila]|uniref:tryptophan aminotransferase-related protein 4-like n=1 Tax=Henckelia pumila TaxID=405737 RepID=UPI003C6E6A70
MWLGALLFSASVILNISLLWNHKYFGFDRSYLEENLSWSRRAALEAEAVASVNCSGHGRAYLDGTSSEEDDHAEKWKLPVCECNTCYGGSDCSQFFHDCAADVDSGDPLFLEPFWMKHAASSAVLVTGWHRMSYSFPDKSSVSQELEKHIRRMHAVAKNAITHDKYIIFGGGSTQLLGAAVYALSMNLSSPASVVAATPFYPLYEVQTEFFQTVRFEFDGDASALKKYADNVIEFVTSPNNPDGNLRRPVSNGTPIYDHAYYWPHFTAIPAPSDQDLMIFTLSKLTGHAGSRFGWAFVKDKEVYDRMTRYISLAEMGISREAQLRALQLVKAILRSDNNGAEIFDFGMGKMRDRWRRLNDVVSLSTRFTLQKIPVRFCNFFQKLREPSPAYAWVKCEREEDGNCTSVLRAANIIGRAGSVFNAEDRYVRLSLLKSDDDFDLLVYRLRQLIVDEGVDPKII